MRYLKQSTSVDLPIGPFLDATDGVTAETALTITQPDIRLKKNAAAWAQKAAAQTLSHEENGWYEVTLDATDTDTLGQLMLAVHESGALPVWHEFSVLPANIYDSLIAGSDVLQADVTQFNGTNGTFASGRPEVNTSHIAGSAVSTSSAQIGVNVVNAGGTAWGSGAITAASIATNAIDADALADAAITYATFDVGAIGSQVIDANAIAEIQAGLATLTKLTKYVQLLARKDAAIATDNATELTAINANGGSGAGAYANTTDSAEATRDNVGTAGAGLTAVAWNAAWDAEVESEVTDGLNAYDPPTRAELTTDTNSILTAVGDVPTNAELTTALGTADDATLAAIAALNNISTAQVKTQVDTALTDIHLDHLLAVDYDPASKPGTATALLNELVESDAGVSRYTANALEQAPAGGGGGSAAPTMD